MLKYLFTQFIVICFLTSQGQSYVHVRNEPRHHNVFENDFVRVLDVYLAPGDTTLYHLHETPSVFIILSNSNVGSRLLGKLPQKGANINGIVSYDTIAKPRIHQVWNEDTSWFHVMDVELTSKNNRNDIKLVSNASLKLLFNEQQVNGYSTELKAGDRLQLPASASGYLIVSKEQASVDYSLHKTDHHRLLKAGHYFWIEPGDEFSIKSNESKAVSFVILQLK